jgi:hypothetical protein
LQVDSVETLVDAYSFFDLTSSLLLKYKEVPPGWEAQLQREQLVEFYTKHGAHDKLATVDSILDPGKVGVCYSVVRLHPGPRQGAALTLTLTQQGTALTLTLVQYTFTFQRWF